MNKEILKYKLKQHIIKEMTNMFSVDVRNFKILKITDEYISVIEYEHRKNIDTINPCRYRYHYKGVIYPLLLKYSKL